jgi:predicted transposase YbfD/YdcC
LPTGTVPTSISVGVLSRSTGETLRGARQDGRRIHLLAAMDHASRAVLAQRQVNGAPGEVGGFVPLLAGLELTGAVVTADALHTHADAAGFLVTGKQAHYLFTVKANQPTLLGRCQRLAWHQVPVLDRTRDRAHGRIELRTLKAVSVTPTGPWPPSASSEADAGGQGWRGSRLLMLPRRPTITLTHNCGRATGDAE